MPEKALQQGPAKTEVAGGGEGVNSGHGSESAWKVYLNRGRGTPGMFVTISVTGRPDNVIKSVTAWTINTEITDGRE